MGTRLRGTASLVLLSLSAAVGSALGQETPQALLGWREWALRGEEHRRCPLLLGGTFGDAAQHPCAWPGRLRLEVDLRSARFTTGWTAYTEAWVPLPGSLEVWPAPVRRGGEAVPVVDRGGQPAVRVAPGRHLFEGELRWEQRPESLPLPESVALVDLVLDGRPVFPVQRDGRAVWLGQAQGGSGQADSLAVQVYRLLSDGVPAMLETRIRLEVSGQGREERLGGVLPAGFVPVSLMAGLTALVEADGRVRVQVRAGRWDLVVVARALEPLASVEVPRASERWAADEVWSYQAQPSLRVTSASGGRSVDPVQVGVPGEWKVFPAMVLSAGEALSVEERSRGLAVVGSTRLRLQREIWLDFHGGGANVRDLVNGRMESGFRLDLAEPFVLARATAGGGPVLVTAGKETGWRGVELRDPDVRLATSGRVDRRPGALPVSGWQSPMEHVAWRLHLPPGRELVAAPGADVSREAWVSRWTVMDVFLVLITALLGWRLLGPTGGGITLAFLGLSYQESMGPLWCLLALFALARLRRAVQGGRGARLATGLLGLTLLVSAVTLLPFVGRQLLLALHPQMEVARVDRVVLPAVGELPLVGGAPEAPQRADKESVEVQPLPAPVTDSATEGRVAMRQRQPPAAPPGDETQGLRSAYHRLTAGAPDKAVMLQQRYAAANVFQAGGGEPGWGWRSASLSWGGPVLPGQTVRLLVTPPWLTRLLRLLVVGLLAALVWRLVGALREVMAKVATAGARSALGVVLLLVVAGPATAQSTPDPALLQQLRERLLAPPPCAPVCAVIAGATVQADGDRLLVTLIVHAEAPMAVPVPGAEATWNVGGITVDGVPAAGTLRRHDGSWWVPVPRGVHHVALAGRLTPVETVEVRFPSPPRRIEMGGTGWEVVGVWEGRLRTDTLTLMRSRDAAGSARRPAATVRVPPFVAVTRELELDLDWSVTTRVERIAPENGSVAVEIPLLPGESVLSPGFEVVAGTLTAALTPGVRAVSWRSRLEHAPSLTLTAPPLEQRAESWRVIVSPQWRPEFRGVPPSAPARAAGLWVHRFDPLPGETLEVFVAQPDALAGPTVAVDRCTLVSSVGRRASDHALDLALRVTRGGQYTITLPADAEVLGVSVGGETLEVRQDEGRLTVPVNPGELALGVRWREARGASVISSLPQVGLGSPASNLELAMNLPASRWVLGTSGPRVGPAVLYWWEIAVLVLVALVLARLGWAPLTFTQWLLLGLGFSVFSWLALAVVAAWLITLEARRRLETEVPWWRFDLMQLALVAFAAVALGCLVAAVPSGLLGSPDLHLTGNGSTPTALRWFADRSDGAIPAAAAVSLPMWVFRLAMLAWALWLAFAVVRWLRWGWACMTAGGGWLRRPRRAPAAPPHSAPAAGPSEAT